MHEPENALYATLLISFAVFFLLVGTLVLTIIRYHRKTMRIRKDLEVRDMDILEGERKRIMYDLHDALAPTITAIQIRLNLMQPEKEEDQKLTAEIKDILQQSAHLIKEVSANLMPASLKADGLSAALKRLTQKMGVSHKVAIRYMQNRELPRLSEERELHIYRMVEEILNNAGRHAKAKDIVLSMECYEDKLSITVKDDGIGFNPSALPEEKRGWGLRHIISRSDILEGEVFLETGIHKGTNYHINIPLSS